MFLLIATSGLPFFTTGFYGFAFLFFMSLLLGLHNNILFDLLRKKSILIIFAIYGILTFSQYYSFGQYSFASAITLPVTFVCTIVIIYFVRNDFVKIYVHIMYLLTILSLMFYTIFLLFPNLYEFSLNNLAPLFELPGSKAGYTYNANILIYTLEQVNPCNIIDIFYDYRNPGPFWEAGAFSIFLNLALFMNGFILKDKFFSK